MQHETGYAVDRRAGEDRRLQAADTRTMDERQLAGERRSNADRRSGLDRRQVSASSLEDMGCQIQSAIGLEDKLKILGRMISELASNLAAIERRIRVIQQNTAQLRQ
jgi:hypothetical protein